MSDISREEVNAKLEAAEARVETRLAIMSGQMNQLITIVTEGREDSREAKEASVKARDAVRSTTWNMMFVALGTIGAVIAIYAWGTQILEATASLMHLKDTVSK